MYQLSNYWIQSSQIKNYIIDDPLIDWLNSYGIKHNLIPNHPHLDQFSIFLSKKSKIFKNKIKKQFTNPTIIHKNQNLHKRISNTINSMYLGKEILIDPVVFDQNLQIYGSPDILIRSDKISKLNLPIPSQCIHNHESLFNDHYHYILINLRSINLKINPNQNNYSNIYNNKKNIFIKAENLLLNQCLGKMQNYQPKFNFIIPEKFNYNQNKKHYVQKYNHQVLGIIDSQKESFIQNKINKSISWLLDLHEKGHQWNLFPPSRIELYPNMCNKDNDSQWLSIKKQIATKLNEITLLWNCGIKQRHILHNNGIYEWNDHKMNLALLHLNPNRTNIISKMIDINHFYQNDIYYLPRKIKKSKNINILHTQYPEFIVDFETINIEENENKSFSGIFMIGCYVNYKDINNITRSKFKQFIAQNLNHQQESNIVNQWIQFMKKFTPNNNLNTAKIYHWGHAEKNIFQQFKKKHQNPIYNFNLNFIDLLHVFKSEPIIIKDAFSYNLKDISKALYNHGIINTIWDEDMNGKEAMINAWIIYNQKNSEKNLLDKIAQYNYYDCKVIDDILCFLRNIT